MTDVVNQSSPKLCNALTEPRKMDEKSEVIEMTADIVSAYVGNNSVAAADLPNLIQSVHRALAGISSGSDVQEAAPKEPAVPVRRSIKIGRAHV